MMRFLHISDLHLGKQLCGFSLHEEQKFMLDKIISVAEQESVNAVLIAGDVYDKSAPSGDAMILFSDFIAELSKRTIPVYIISGNHDSAQRISYFSDIIRDRGVFVTDRFDGKLQTFTVQDEFGKINIQMLPFIKPVNVRGFFPDTQIETYADAVAAVLDNSEIDLSGRNILLCHQFITGCEKSGSEAMSVGGLENIPSSLFDGFDYVAMGHIHGAQKAGRDAVRYCGSPMKYDASEADQTKTLTVVDIEKKGDVNISFVPLAHLRDLVRIEGEFNELMCRGRCDDFAAITITDEEFVPDAAVMLRQVYPKMISFGIRNSKSGTSEGFGSDIQIENKTPTELFCEFFSMMKNDVQPTEEQMKIIVRIFDEAGGDEN